MSADASAVAAPPGARTRLDTSLCLGWGIGALGMSLMFAATSVLLLRYLVDYVGIAAAVAGLLISLARMYDALIDPLVGVASDRTHSRWGRRRPWLLWGGLLSATSFVMIFHLDGVADSLKVTAALFVLLANASGYALFNVPYLAMPGEMTDDYHERTRLMSFRVAAVAAGQLFASSVGPLLIVRLGGGATGHERTAWLLGAGIYTIVEKLSFSIGPALVGVVLGASGYVASASGEAIQPAAALRAMYVCIAVLPVLSIAAGCLLLRGYRLDERAFVRS
ncbi:MAG: MFS transporter [Gammaproteobacteria bacterium]|nr:MFS transporter [Gammaproteobacteria bacterium]